jgi:2-oxoglutarate ferredoxin oxidoreductase subunit alpha
LSSKRIEEIEDVAIRFAGDSGDGMQLTGTKFTEATALAGNDLSTFPDYPAEIRAPAGSIAGVSGFQIHFASRDIHTPADAPDVLVAMNPAALKANVADLRPKGMLIVNSDAFSERNLKLAGYASDPLPDLREPFQLVEIPLTKLTREAVKDLTFSQREADRSKNFFALGLMYWLYGRPLDGTLQWIKDRFKGDVQEANRRVLLAGYHFGETTELFPVSYVVPRAKIEPGRYRNITGNQALAWGILAAGAQMNRPIFLGAYPITPASDVLHELSRYRHFGVKTFQAEDEIAAAGAAIGAAFSGQLALCTTSGPGMVLKQEAVNLAVMTELPIVIIDIQRAGPSTGMPTKVEQGDLLLALFGRNSDSPIPVIAASTPGDCFHAALDAFRVAVKYMTPVVLLSDAYLANSSEPWKIPDVETLPRSPVTFRTDPEGFQPYARNAETLAREWAIPGTPGLEHRIGGLEKEDGTGSISYSPANHERMQQLRHEKVARIAQDVPPVEVTGADRGDLLVLGWGSTSGAIDSAVEEAQALGHPVSSAHLRWLNPFPSNLGDVLRRFKRVLIPELNAGQLSLLIRARYLVDARSLSKVQGQPFKVGEIRARIESMLRGEA